MPERPVMYLEHGDWSPRYEDTFYTVRLDHFELRTSPPPSDAVEDNNHHEGSVPRRPPKNHLGGRTSFPAYYYKVEVFCGRHPPRVVLRRFSQFRWLHETLAAAAAGGGGGGAHFPAGGGCFAGDCFGFCRPQTEVFARHRSGDLREFLTEALARRDVANHEVVAEFLELDELVADAPEVAH